VNTAEALALYYASELPEDIRVVSLPMRRTAYGDLQITSKYQATIPDQLDHDGFTTTESIDIHRFVFVPHGQKQIHYAGYGPKSKTLVLAKEEE